MAQASITPEKLKDLTIAELKKLAAKQRVELRSMLKADIVKELAKTLKPKKKPAKKTAPKKAAVKKAAIKKSSPKKKSTAKKKPSASRGTIDIASMTVTELRALAEKNSIVLKKKLKADILKELSKALMPKKNAPAKKVAKKKAPVEKSAGKAKKSPAKPKAQEPAMKSSGASGQKARTALPLGTAPPRSPEPGMARTTERTVSEPGPWKPRTPETTTENWASAIPVEPGRLFVSWDIEQDSVPDGRRIVMRVMDIPETESQGEEKAGSFIQVPVKTLSGGMFINVSKSHCYRAAIGTMGMDGDFQPIVITDPVTTPSGVPSEGSSLLEEEHFLFNSSLSKGPVSSS